MNNQWKRIAATLAIATAALAFTACSDDDDPDAADDTPTTAAAVTSPEPESSADAAPTSATAATKPAGDTTILIGEVDPIGQVLTDADGLTLYTFKNDTADSGTSACVDSCVNVWPPSIVEGTPTGPADINDGLGTITRPEGTKQVTYKGLPLYRFVNDATPGVAGGDTVGDVWFAAQP